MPDYVIMILMLGGMAVFGINGFVLGPARSSSRCGTSTSRSGQKQVPCTDHALLKTKTDALFQTRLHPEFMSHRTAFAVPYSAGLSIMSRFIPALLLVACGLCSTVQAEVYSEAPRVVAVLAQGLAAERGIGIRENPGLAIELYCDAGAMGSSEGFFRIGRLLSEGSPRLRNPRLANAYLALAARLGHRQASMLHNPLVENARIDEICNKLDAQFGQPVFDLEGYIAGLTPAKRNLAALIRKKAPQYGVDARMALGIALAESNLDASAVSPRNAQGVMQLIPDTQERFGVLKPFDPEQNIKGGLAYLKWLQNRFSGNLTLVAAAYNAGEGSIDRYGGVPPFPETQQYVRRVLNFSGMVQLPLE